MILPPYTEGVVSRDIVGEEVERVLVGEGLELVKRKVPLGVVLVVFESRPDCLPQVTRVGNTYHSVPLPCTAT